MSTSIIYSIKRIHFFFHKNGVSESNMASVTKVQWVNCAILMWNTSRKSETLLAIKICKTLGCIWITSWICTQFALIAIFRASVVEIEISYLHNAGSKMPLVQS